MKEKGLGTAGQESFSSKQAPKADGSCFWQNTPQTHRSQTLGQLGTSNERITWVQYPGTRSQDSTSTASNDSFMHNRRITPFTLHSCLHLCLIICNLRSTTIHLTKHLSVTLLTTEVPRRHEQAAVGSLPAGAGFSTSAALQGWLTPRTGCSAGTRSSNLWVSFLNTRTLSEKQLYFPQTGYYFPRQGIGQLVTHVCGCWLKVLGILDSPVTL